MIKAIRAYRDINGNPMYDYKCTECGSIISGVRKSALGGKQKVCASCKKRRKPYGKGNSK